MLRPLSALALRRRPNVGADDIGDTPSATLVVRGLDSEHTDEAVLLDAFARSFAGAAAPDASRSPAIGTVRPHATDGDTVHGRSTCGDRRQACCASVWRAMYARKSRWALDLSISARRSTPLRLWTS